MADIYKPLVYILFYKLLRDCEVFQLSGGGGYALIYFGEYVAKTQLVKLSMKTGRQENRGKVSLICLTPKVYKQYVVVQQGLVCFFTSRNLVVTGRLPGNHRRHWLLALTSHLL